MIEDTKIKFIILLLVAIGVSIYFFTKKDSKNNSILKIKSVELWYTTGYHINADEEYKLICDDNCILNVKLDGEEESTEYIVDKKIKEEVEGILNKYSVYKWDGFNKSDKGVLDGNSFHFYVLDVDDKKISASGYMMWPQNYRDVKNELINIFNKYIKE